MHLSVCVTVLPSCKHATCSCSRRAVCFGSSGGLGLPAPSLRTARYTAALSPLCSSLQLGLCIFPDVDPVNAENYSRARAQWSPTCVNKRVAHLTPGRPSCVMQLPPAGEARTQPAGNDFSGKAVQKTISRQERSATLDLCGLGRTGKTQSGGLSHRLFQHSCMRVNIKGPRCVQLRAQEVVLRELGRSWVTDLSRVADSIASACHALVHKGGHVMDNTKRQVYVGLLTCAAMNPSPRLECRNVVNSAARNAE